MARRVYFTFDHRDVFKVNQVRRSGQFAGVAKAGFAGASPWERLKKRDPAVIRAAIDRALVGASVTVVVRPRTASRRWVTYEPTASIARGNGVLGVFLPGESGHAKPAALTRVGAPLYAFNAARFPIWVEAAALRARRS